MTELSGLPVSFGRPRFSTRSTRQGRLQSPLPNNPVPNPILPTKLFLPIPITTTCVLLPGAAPSSPSLPVVLPVPSHPSARSRAELLYGWWSWCSAPRPQRLVRSVPSRRLEEPPSAPDPGAWSHRTTSMLSATKTAGIRGGGQWRTHAARAGRYDFQRSGAQTNPVAAVNRELWPPFAHKGDDGCFLSSSLLLVLFLQRQSRSGLRFSHFSSRVVEACVVLPSKSESSTFVQIHGLCRSCRLHYVVDWFLVCIIVLMVQQ